MQRRLVFWGENPQNEKVLMGLMLDEEGNKIDAWVFPANEISEEFAQQFRQEWRKGQDILFPENHLHLEIPLRISESIIPEGYKVDRDDIIKRAQTEWHFIVLSSKLYRAYQDELEDIQDQIGKLTDFDSGLWEDLKGFWSKVQEQAREKNLFREHAYTIKEKTNELFEELKELRKKVDRDLHLKSKEHLQQFRTSLDELEEKVNKGLSLNPIFQELKEIQKKFKDTEFTKSHRNQIWKKIDGLFKMVKEKKYGAQSAGNDPTSRLTKRYEGLLGAIQRMERSIARDKKDISYESGRADRADGSLEAQIRAAKVMMIEQRMASKQEKLDDMLKTRTKLEKDLARLQKQKEAQLERQKIKDAKAELKAKIADDIKDAAEERSGSESIQKAVEAIQEASAPVVEEIEEGMEDVIDTIKAVASVIELRFGGLVEDLSSKIKEISEEEE